MSRSAAADMAALIISEGLATGVADIFINKVPDAPNTPDNVIVVNDFPSYPPSKTMNASQAATIREYNTVQVRVRNVDGQTGYNLIYGIYLALDGYYGTIDSVEYDLVSALQTPAVLLHDEKERVHYYVNFNVTRTPAS